MKLHSPKLILVWVGRAQSFVKCDQNEFFRILRGFSGGFQYKKIIKH